MALCTHSRVTCLNQHELVRKYRCRDCGGVMMCGCDEERGTKFLPHQLDYGTEWDGQYEIAVTLGFQQKVCSECRGLRPDHAPAAAIHGRTSNLNRYYWRELFFLEQQKLTDWSAKNEVAFEAVPAEIRAACEAQALAEVKALHASTPKYAYARQIPSDEFLKANEVEIVELKARQLPTSGKKALLDDTEGACHAEDFAARHFRRLGYQVSRLESRPLHVLFGIYMWLAIHDVADPDAQLVGFGSRTAFDKGDTIAPPIWMMHPNDFGYPAYARRRKKAIDRHFRLLRGHKDDFAWLFDLWLDASNNLREYLWAHKPEDVRVARLLIEIIPSDDLLQIFRYLIGGYWQRYLGWPDLIVFNRQGFFLVEVKFSKDKLSDEQRDWMKGNRRFLKLPFKLVKIHRLPT